MGNEQLVICGGAPPDLDCLDADALRLHLYGSDDEHKITLAIEDIRQQMYKDVPVRLRDMLDIATYVYAADQATVRGAYDVETFGSSWRRRFRFVVPVSDLEFWQSARVKQTLSDTLGFLSDDHYEFEFVPLRNRPSLQTFLKFLNEKGAMLGSPEQAMMFSGGLDSLGGAVEEIVNQKRRVVLVNHCSTHKLDTRYGVIRDLLDAKAPHNRPVHIRVTVHKKKWMNREYTQRSRSFLYVTLGATIAWMLGQSNVRFYENGVISMNLPICAQVVGGKATRTTHPRVLRDFGLLLSLVVDGPFVVDNQFQWKTKSEVVDLIAKAGCTEMIGPSISCTHVWEMTTEHSHCGTCSQCVDRRIAIIAANAEAFDPVQQYAVDVFTESQKQSEKVHEDKTLFANYLERANQVNRVPGPTQFVAKYPEVVRALKFLNCDTGTAAQRCFDLYRRHSAEVNSAIDKMLTKHGTAIRQRILPADSMMRIVYESQLPTAVPTVPVYEESLPDNVFRRHGGAWQVRYKGKKPFTVLPLLGASYIHYLMSSPGVARPAVDIVCSSAMDSCSRLIGQKEAIDLGLQSAANPMLACLDHISDWEAVKNYREHARELLEAIAKARRDHDTVLERQYESDMVKVIAQINDAVGIGGRLKQAKDKRKNIRDSFRNSVKRVIDTQIAVADQELASHLNTAIAFGNVPRYRSEVGVSWETDPVKNS